MPGGADDPRLPAAKLEEAIGLAHGIELEVAHAETARVARPSPATLIGKGTVERIRDVVSGAAARNRVSGEAERIAARTTAAADAEEGDADEPDNKRRRAAGRDPDVAPIGLCIVDAALSPVQQRNLERAWNAKVIDRTGLILEIFGARARTREGRLQVELAALNYQRGRLVRSWTHLERQRGGFGFMGGPGESQIETDRRLIGERIARLERDLKDVVRTRELHRKARRRVPYPIVALVGYTNAGKSTLFNRLTRANVEARDQLFATLDPTMRGHVLPGGQAVILSDTVGFISDLPHELVAAFRATLEEVLEADVLVHVRDVSHPDTEAQKADVEAVLRELDLGAALDSGNVIEALNKIDLLDDDPRDSLANRAARVGERALIPISAVTGEGLRDLGMAIEHRLTAGHDVITATVPLHDGATIAWLYAHGDVLTREDDDAWARLTVRLPPADAERFRRRPPSGSEETTP